MMRETWLKITFPLVASTHLWRLSSFVLLKLIAMSEVKLIFWRFRGWAERAKQSKLDWGQGFRWQLRSKQMG